MKMKSNVTLSFIAISFTADTVAAQCNGAGTCTAENVKSQCTGFGDIDNEDIEKACTTAFMNLAGNHYQFDKNYMDGGTLWNDGTSTSADEVAVQEDSIQRAKDSISSNGRIGWPVYEALENYVAGSGPAYMSNFNLTKSCDLNTVMCCFTNNDKIELGDGNADVCAHDLRDSRRSNHIKNGWAAMEDGPGTYCQGFSWSDGDESDFYKGNSLFQISYINTVDNGYYKNIPSAPMCGCLEKMPVVTNAACLDVTAENESFVIELSDGSVEATVTASVVHSDCGVDLAADIVAKGNGDAAKVARHITGESGCDTARADMQNEKFWVSGASDAFEVIDEVLWGSAWAGWGIRYWPIPYCSDCDGRGNDYAKLDTVLRPALNASPNKIIRRYCDSCLLSHRDIYYKRLTPVPEDGFYLSEMFLSDWFSVNNEFHVDFELYSTFQDAIDGTNEWTYCNFNDNNVGFPRDCGPSRKIDFQWNAYERRMGPVHISPYHHAFFVEQPPL